MKHMRFLLSFSALVMGFGILALSLTTATAAQSSTGSYEASQRQFYWDEEVLPDHVGYPVLMAIDRVKLETASSSERVYLQVEYGNQRLQDAKSLVDKENVPLALTTATKGYKYLILASQESLDQKMPEPVKHHVIKALEYHLKDLEAFKTKFSDSDRAILDQLAKEAENLKQRLQNS